MRNIKIARKKLDRVIETIGDKPVSVASFCRYLNKEFRTLSVKFHSKKGNYFSVAGNYNGSKDRDGGLKYDVVITYDKKTPRFTLTKEYCDELFIILVHEFRHGYQEGKRRRVIQPFHKHPHFKHNAKDIVEEVNYLSDYDEIDAYAYEVAYVFNHYMKNTENRHITASWVVNRYRNILGIFAPKLYNRFLKKIYKNIHK